MLSWKRRRIIKDLRRCNDFYSPKFGAPVFQPGGISKTYFMIYLQQKRYRQYGKNFPWWKRWYGALFRFIVFRIPGAKKRADVFFYREQKYLETCIPEYINFKGDMLTLTNKGEEVAELHYPLKTFLHDNIIAGIIVGLVLAIVGYYLTH